MGIIALAQFIYICLQATVAPAATVTYDSCLQRCSMEAGQKGQVKVFCRCDSRERPGRRWETGDHDSALRRGLAARLRGASEAELDQVGRNSCGESGFQRPSMKEWTEILRLDQRPLCECVEARRRFPVTKSCRQTKAGEKLCEFYYRPRNSDGLDALRPATLYDYQSCIADRLSHRAPASCLTKDCDNPPAACPPGEEAVNIADEGACCPVYQCRPKGER